MMPLFCGVPIIVSELAYITDRKQVRFPKSKRRRIQKKWSKRECNWKVTQIPQAYKTPRGFIMHPLLYSNLVAEIQRSK